MKHLFLIRHGVYDYTDRLSDRGKEQMKNLSNQIKRILNGGSAYILSSTASRATDSSEVLAEELGLASAFDKTEDLWTGGDSTKERKFFCDSDKIMEMINEKRETVDGLILVSHLEVADEFPEYFIEKEFNKSASTPRVDKGQAVHFDLEKRTYGKLR